MPYAGSAGAALWSLDPRTGFGRVCSIYSLAYHNVGSSGASTAMDTRHRSADTPNYKCRKSMAGTVEPVGNGWEPGATVTNASASSILSRRLLRWEPVDAAR